MIYFDNAATTWQKPEQVYQTVDDVLRNKSGNPSRGSHQISLDASRVIFKVRKKLADFFNIQDSSQLAFTKNATESSNLIFKGFLNSGDHVIISSLEHNAITRPLHRLEEEGVIDLTVVDTEQGSAEFLTRIKEAITPQTKLVALTHASNVTGNILPVAEVGDLLADKDTALLVDAAQTAGVVPIDIEQLKVDFLVFTGHKALFGPQGVGGFYFNDDFDLEPLLEGGTGGSSKEKLNPDLYPDQYESGTLNTAGIAGLGAGIDFINQTTLTQIRKHEMRLLEKLTAGLQQISEIELLTSQISEERVGVTSFRVQGIDAVTVGQLLNSEYQIAVRTGLHCAPLAHQSIGSYETGTVRVSFSYFNTLVEVEEFLDALEEIIDFKSND
ncbi:aminotransferase class V-fold PLP-dependent enzyme [Halanaerobacter jeridensis]|uniref:cysteine desulfurase n=1 Tax=Halanaerobacter jeridensis TaxID=706427 RepID=A0A939BMS5_9FIRM|nr:aminotransferase class V-fold PLP-dependent enzyme [Halanaerobacter jeridensis]MBM7557315.1 cysteine desulfurase family protein [Halanaerobacter jeridensis]